MARPRKDLSGAAPKLVTDSELRMILAILKNNKSELNLDWAAVARDTNRKVNSAQSALSGLRKKGLVPYAGTAADTLNAKTDTAQLGSSAPGASSSSNSKTAKPVPKRRAPRAGRKRKAAAAADATAGTATTTGAAAVAIADNGNNQTPPANKNKKAKVQNIVSRVLNQRSKNSPFLADSSESDTDDVSVVTHHPPAASGGADPQGSSAVATASRDYYERLAQEQLEADEQLQGDIVRCTEDSDRYNVAITGAHGGTNNTITNNPIANARPSAAAPEVTEATSRQGAQAAVDDDYDDGYSDDDNDDMQTHPSNASDQDMFAQIARAASYDRLVPPAVL
ncbi:hypothetical protein MN608_00989 [Microdochium nivale]|nr:hypothetical protein MN608_00989 [Microdochium nivale]